MLDLNTTTAAAAPSPTTAPQTSPVREIDLDYFRPAKGAWLMIVLGGAIALALLIGMLVLLEKYAPETWKPSQIIGSFPGNVETAAIKARLDATILELRSTSEEKARLEIEVKDAEARLQTMMKGYESQLQMQQESFNQELARTSQAYAALYERGNMMAKATADLVTRFMQQRVDLAQAHQGGKLITGVVADIFAALGDATGNPSMAESARRVQASAYGASMTALNEAIAQELPKFQIGAWAHGLPDPAEFTYRQNSPRKSVVPPTPPTPKRDAPPPQPYSVLPKEKSS